MSHDPNCMSAVFNLFMLTPTTDAADFEGRTKSEASVINHG